MATAALRTDIQTAIAADMAAVNQLILSEIDSRIPLVKTVALHLIESGGKRLRPTLVLLAARALGYAQEDNEPHELATIIEFIHTATLLHDDVIDHSTQRRGQDTANAIWSNTTAVLVGDFLYSRAFQILARRHNIPVMRTLADATNRLSEAEVLQLTLAGNPDIKEEQYFAVIDGKTAQLYAAAAHIGAIVATSDVDEQKNMRDFGWNLGMAFQIIDDLLDYNADATQLGKNLGDDLSEGKMTLPLITALKHANPADKSIIQDAIKNADKTQFSEVMRILKTTRAIEVSAEIAYNYAKQAQQHLKNVTPSIYTVALTQLTQFVLNRQY